MSILKIENMKGTVTVELEDFRELFNYQKKYDELKVEFESLSNEYKILSDEHHGIKPKRVVPKGMGLGISIHPKD